MDHSRVQGPFDSELQPAVLSILDHSKKRAIQGWVSRTENFQGKKQKVLFLVGLLRRPSSKEHKKKHTYTHRHSGNKPQDKS